MPPPTPTNLEDQLAAALDVIIDQLGEVDERWPPLLAEHEARGSGRISQAEAAARLGPGFAGHALFRAYDGLSLALAALQEHHHACDGDGQETAVDRPRLDDAAVAETAVVSAPAAVDTGTEIEPGHGKRPLATRERGPGASAGTMCETTDACDEEASVSIDSGRAVDRRGETAKQGRALGDRPARPSLRDRLSFVLNGTSEAAASETLPERVDRRAETSSPPGHRRGEPRASRPPLAAPVRRSRGLWREEASVVIVRSAAQSQPDEPAPSSGSAGER